MMKRITLTTVVITAFLGLTEPVFADADSSKDTTAAAVVDTAALSTLLTIWEAETDALTKAGIAKKIQQQLGVKVDGLIGKRTMSAIKATGVTTDFTKPTRAENGATKLVLAVADGKITQDEANVISKGRASITAIKDQVKSGDLTREDVKTQIDDIKDSLPAKPEKDKARKSKSDRKAGGKSDRKGGGKSGGKGGGRK